MPRMLSTVVFAAAALVSSALADVTPSFEDAMEIPQDKRQSVYVVTCHNDVECGTVCGRYSNDIVAFTEGIFALANQGQVRLLICARNKGFRLRFVVTTSHLGAVHPVGKKYACSWATERVQQQYCPHAQGTIHRTRGIAARMGAVGARASCRPPPI